MNLRIPSTTLFALLSLGLAISAHGFTFTRDKHNTTVPADKARIIVTEQLGLLKIDTEKYNRYAFNSGETIVDVTPGQHVFSIRYDWLWNYDYDNFDALKSDPVDVTIQAEAGKTYKITHRDIPNYKVALDFSRKPEMLVVEADSGKQVSQPAPQAEMATTVKAAKEASTTSQPTASQPVNAAVATAAAATTTSVATTPADKSTPELTQSAQNAPASLPMLQYWWNQANPAEQKQFRDWIQSR